MANQEHVDLLRQGTEVWNAWRKQHPEVHPDLSGAILSGAYLSDVTFSHANLSKATLYNANLSKATLSHATLSFAYLTGVNLSGATLSHAILSDAYLSGAYLNHAKLDTTNFTNTHFWDTLFADVDLSSIIGLETAIHHGPSTVNINSVILPRNKHTRNLFLRGVGFSDAFIEYLPSLLTPAALQYYSLFLGYAHPDETLAHRLYQDLQNKGVRCWMAPHDLRPGDYHHSRIDEAIRLHEKLLLLLSEHAVNSSWVKHEVQIALAREIAQDCTVLFPLRLDQAVMQTNKDWAVQLRESRHIGDFTNWQDDTAYQEAFSTLLRHLKVSKSPTV